MESQQVNDPVLSNIYANAFNIPIELARILAYRLPKYGEASKFLKPQFKDLHEPDFPPDISVVSDRLMNKIQKNETILIYGHDDPDGFTSAALMFKTLKETSRGGAPEIHVYIFDREKDGYIINPDILKKFRRSGCNTILTVDFGISSAENFRIARENNFELLVCDHHETKLDSFPMPAIDPKRPDSKYPFRDLAGVGVALKLAIFLYRQILGLSSAEFFALKKEFLALAMICTIADRVTLLNENRVLCHAGIDAANKISYGWLHEFQKIATTDFGRVISEIIPTLASAAYVDQKMTIELLFSDETKRFLIL